MALYEQPAELLSALIRFDTSNPPGNEAGIIRYIDGLLREAGITTTLVGRTPDRPNLIARLKGRGEAPPVLLYGHVDVVPASGQVWDVAPFEGLIQDGVVWGRGAVDMKGGDTMFLCALLRAKAEGLELPGDLIVAMTSDEEQGSEFGAQYVVSEHAHHFDGVRYALSEFGGYTSYISGARFYPITMAERRVCTVEATIRGPGGHGAQRHRGTAMARLGRMLLALDEGRLPVHVQPLVARLFETVAVQLDEPERGQIAALTDPERTDAVLDAAWPTLRAWDNLLHNSVNPTIIHAGTATNVIPSEIKVTLDGRVLPEITTGAFLDEIRGLIGDDIALKAVKDEPVRAFSPDMTHFETLSRILKAADPGGTPLPYMAGGASDARFFAQLGIQTYGFTPLKLPADLSVAGMMHAANERVPVEALEFGVAAVYEAMQALYR
jgi:acetylornithine deacetylase/succinyl-diaminopimelate desuccinylase-like protein